MESKRSVICAVVFASAAVAFSTPLAAQQQRIVGGAPVLLDQAPSIVALISTAAINASGSFFQSQFCAGTLISETFVVTAAHCVTFSDEQSDPGDLGVLIDTFDLNNPGGELISVAEIIVHDEYRSSSNSYDIALLRLDTAIDSPTADLIDPAVVLQTDEVVTVAGWGARMFSSAAGSTDFPSLLEGAAVLALPGEICNALPSMLGRVDETMVCARVVGGGVDACQGDSGGPLYRQGVDGELILAGITSWGIGCALEDFPGVYSNVAFFNDWILDRAGDTLIGPVEPLPPVVVVPEPLPPVVVVPEPLPPVVVVPEPLPPVVVVPEPLPPVVVTTEPTVEPLPPVVAEPGTVDFPVTVATNELAEVTGGDIPTISVSGGGSGIGSAGGMLLGALAFFGVIRRRSALDESTG